MTTVVTVLMRQARHDSRIALRFAAFGLPLCAGLFAKCAITRAKQARPDLRGE